jgi:hypothetical protein
MNINFPFYLSWLFVLSALATLLILIWVIMGSSTYTARKTRIILCILIAWLSIQAALSLNQVYSSNLAVLPPKILVLGIFPAVLSVIVLFILKKGKAFIDSLPLRRLIYINLVRIPIEIGLWFLYINQWVPKLMTWEGGNLDIISGLSAPIVAYYAFRKHSLSQKFLLAWNILCLFLLGNIVIRAFLSAPFPFQKLAFDQPNIAILYFPVVWLPTFIVPVVLFGQLTSLRKLTFRGGNNL